jgi:transposase
MRHVPGKEIKFCRLNCSKPYSRFTDTPQRGDHRQPIGEDHRKRGIRGFDTHKQIKGRKRHIFVDTLGLLLTVVVTAASVQDRDGGKLLLEGIRHQCSQLRRIWADGAYGGDLIAWVWALRPWRKVRLEIIRRPKGIKGFQLLPGVGLWSGPSAGWVVTAAYPKIMST